MCASLCTRVVCVCAASCAASCVYSASAGTSGTTSDRTSDGPRTCRHSLSPLPPPYSDLSSPPSLSLPFPTLSSPSIPSPTRSPPSFPSPALPSPALPSPALPSPTHVLCTRPDPRDGRPVPQQGAGEGRREECGGDYVQKRTILRQPDDAGGVGNAGEKKRRAAFTLPPCMCSSACVLRMQVKKKTDILSCG